MTTDNTPTDDAADDVLSSLCVTVRMPHLLNFYDFEGEAKAELHADIVASIDNAIAKSDGLLAVDAEYQDAEGKTLPRSVYRINVTDAARVKEGLEVMKVHGGDKLISTRNVSFSPAVPPHSPHNRWRYTPRKG